MENDPKMIFKKEQFVLESRHENSPKKQGDTATITTIIGMCSSHVS